MAMENMYFAIWCNFPPKDGSQCLGEAKRNLNPSLQLLWGGTPPPRTPNKSAWKPTWPY
jgi:hypothetical protein